MSEIKIATDFSRYPGGRYRKLGKYSGEEFRDEILVKALMTEDAVSVILDGTAGYGSSFLEEAFGGLVRAGIGSDIVKRKLKLVAKDPEFETYISEIWQYIDDAAARA
jgi:uncharacterized protein DUF4325